MESSEASGILLLNFIIYFFIIFSIFLIIQSKKCLLKLNSHMHESLAVFFHAVLPCNCFYSAPFFLQYQGFGTLLMEESEKIAREEHGSVKIAVISGKNGNFSYVRSLSLADNTSCFYSQVLEQEIITANSAMNSKGPTWLRAFCETMNQPLGTSLSVLVWPPVGRCGISSLSTVRQRFNT